MSMKMFFCAALAAGCAIFASSRLVAEEAAKEQEERSPDSGGAASEEPKKRKLPKQTGPYNNWDLAAKVADSHDQPIIVFVGLQGDKNSSRIRNATIFNPAFKDFIKSNAVLYLYNVPALKEKKNVRSGNCRQKKDKNARPKPDLKSVKQAERLIVGKVAANNLFPVVAVVSPAGQIAGTPIVVDPSDPYPFGRFIADLKSAFEAGKYSCEITKKVQKEIDAQAKKIADLEKRQRK